MEAHEDEIALHPPRPMLFDDMIYFLQTFPLFLSSNYPRQTSFFNSGLLDFYLRFALFSNLGVNPILSPSICQHWWKRRFFFKDISALMTLGHSPIPPTSTSTDQRSLGHRKRFQPTRALCRSGPVLDDSPPLSDPPHSRQASHFVRTDSPRSNDCRRDSVRSLSGSRYPFLRVPPPGTVEWAQDTPRLRKSATFFFVPICWLQSI